MYFSYACSNANYFLKSCIGRELQKYQKESYICWLNYVGLPLITQKR